MSESFVKGESSLPEAPEKWLCAECGETFKKPLSAPNPFEPSETICGCPFCKEVEKIFQACQVGDCNRYGDSGNPGAYGYRYIWTCRGHSPYRN